MRLLADAGKKKQNLHELQDYEINEKYTKTDQKPKEVFIDEKEEQPASKEGSVFRIKKEFVKEVVSKSPLQRRKLDPLSSKSRCQEGGGDTQGNNTFSASSSNGFKLLGGLEFRRPPDDELIDSDDNFDEF